ncbi:MAG TPA: hydrolase, partial [Polyangiales bacterium]|nr:hydrolase [Polyangiales bacterium]
MSTQTATITATKSEPIAETGCCPRFEPAPWDEKEITWHDKPFVREQLRSVFHIPLGMPKHVMHAQSVIDAAHAQSERPWM